MHCVSNVLGVALTFPSAVLCRVDALPEPRPACIQMQPNCVQPQRRAVTFGYWELKSLELHRSSRVVFVEAWYRG